MSKRKRRRVAAASCVVVAAVAAASALSLTATAGAKKTINIAYFAPLANSYVQGELDGIAGVLKKNPNVKLTNIGAAGKPASADQIRTFFTAPKLTY